MDADFSHHPKYLPDLIEGMESAPNGPVDVMLGTRYGHGGGVEGWPLSRKLMSRMVNCMLEFVSVFESVIAADHFAVIVRRC